MERQKITFISILFLVVIVIGWLCYQPIADQKIPIDSANGLPIPAVKSNMTPEQAVTPERIATPSNNAEADDGDKKRLEETATTPFIISCQPLQESQDVLDELDEISEDYESFLAKAEQLSKPFKNNTDTASRLALAFLTNVSDSKDRVGILSSVLELEPNNQLANWDLLNLCSQDSFNDMKECSGRTFENAKEVHHQNGAAWIFALETANDHSNTDAIVEALEQVIAAPTFNDYYGEYMSLARQVFTDSNNGKLSQEQTEVLSFIAIESIPTLNGIIEFCKEKAINNDHLSNLCLEAGKRMTFSSKTALLQMIGFGLQKYALKNLGNQLAVEKIEFEMEQSRYFRSDLWKKASALLEYDSELYDRWLQNLIDRGEMAAGKILIQEAIELSKDEFYQPCGAED